MAQTPEADLDEATKKDRIINAYIAYPDTHAVDRDVIAEVAGATTSYLSTIKRQVLDGDLTEEDVGEARDETLISYFEDRLDELIDEHDVPETTDESEDWRLDEEAQSVGEEEEAEEAEGETEGEEAEEEEVSEEGSEESAEGGELERAVPASKIEDLREDLVDRREEADFERSHYDGEAANVAEAKFYLSDRLLGRVDSILEGEESS